jgi:hypothetical protein
MEEIVYSIKQLNVAVSADDESQDSSQQRVAIYGKRSAEDESEESSRRGVRTLLLGLLPGAIAVRTRLCFKD